MKSSFPTLLFLIAAHYLFATRLEAHREVAGDMYPEVKVEGKEFAVYFYNNTGQSNLTLPKSPEEGLAFFLNRYAANGTLLQERLPAPRRNILPDAPWSPAQDERGLHFIRRVATGDKFPLSWHVEETLLSSGYFEKGSDLYLLLFFLSAQSNRGTDKFYLGRYNLTTRKLDQAVSIGVPVRIMVLPVVSQVVVGEDNVALVAWIDEPAHNLVVSRWSAGGSEVYHHLLVRNVGWNASVSLNRIKNDILVAWHTDGKVFTEHIDLNDLSCDYKTVSPTDGTSTATKSER